MNADQNPKFNLRFVVNVLLKALVLFVILNLLFATFNPLPFLGKLSIYNWLVPGRARLPFGENPEAAYNLSLFNLNAMFAAHEIAGAHKAAEEYRVVLIGDSSVWGYWLTNEETLSANLNAAGLKTDGKRIVVYNLGYPTISLTKDLLLLDRALAYEPDLVVWLVTLESFPYEKQTFTPLVQQNPWQVQELIAEYGLNIDPTAPNFVTPTFWQHTIVGQRRQLADVLRLQLYGVPWAATGIDQDIPQYDDPADYQTRQEDFEADESFYDLTAPLTEQDVAFDVLAAGVGRAGDTPVLIINEPMFISAGENSDIRYNFFYPRWAYDDYRKLMTALSAENNWHYLDLWDAISPAEFTNSAIHLTPDGSTQLAELVAPAILEIARE
ncbi:MAG: SGNH/GDSL hydrolase family protein [Anaerolineales bacterium]|nr:SGNH/GDSL hydrolase family protein [Anaerolineales bacterium]